MKRFFTVFLIFLIPLTLASDTQRRFKVYVTVEGEENTRQAVNTIENHLKRELRLLGDVDVVGKDDNWEYIIEILVSSIEWKDRTQTGWYAISTYNATRLPRFTYTDPANYTALQATWGGILGTAYYSDDTLSKFCINHVGGFDKTILEPLRSLYR